ESGCVQSNSTICREGICMNGGTCKPLSDTQYRCACAEFYYGLHCEKVSACIGAPCANGGICENSGPGQVKCICPIGFYGQWCELEENSCGAHFAESVGNLTFPDNGEMPAEQQCDFVISTGEENSVRSYRTVKAAQSVVLMHRVMEFESSSAIWRSLSLDYPPQNWKIRPVWGQRRPYLGKICA
ncbi:EGF-like domain protein, partial [Ostertagia ostertagi]